MYVNKELRLYRMGDEGMNINKRNKQDKSGSWQAAGRECPAGMDLLKAGVICCLLDDSFTLLWGNSGFFRLTGYTREHFYHLFPNLREFFSLFPDDFAAIRHEAAQAVNAGSSDIDITIRLPRQSDGFFWVRLLGTITADSVEGSPVLQMEFANISALTAEKEEMNRLFQQQHHCFRSVLDTYEGNAYVSDISTYELLYLNQTSCQVLGMPAWKAVGRKCYEIIQGRTSPCPFCTNDKLCTEEFYNWEFHNPTLGRTFLIRDLEVSWEGHRARLELSHDTFSAEYRLAKKDQERDALISSVHGGFARVDARDMRTVLWYGGGFLSLIGYTKNEFEQELHSQCTYVHPDDIVQITNIMEQSRTTGRPTAAEGRVVTYHGDIKILALSFSFVSAQDSWDGVPSYYSVGLDVTRERMEQVRQKQVLEDACKTAQIANDAKTNFLSSMSHDIRTPMNAIIGMSVIAQANLNSPDKIQDCLAKINTASRHLLNLINEVLDMSKIESGKIDLISEEVFLPDLIEDVMDVFRPLVEEKHQTLRVNANRVRHEKVITDRGRLQQVLVNLLSNATKYTPDGGIIGLRIQEIPCFAKGKGQYSFVVTDSGIGMQEDFIPHVFEPFSRADDARINNIQGTGLGMAITQNIVRMMNGTIEVKSTPGKGSQFVVAVTFDLCRETEADYTELAGLPVLVADDDRIICESVTEILNELGMQCNWVLSGREAVDRVAAAHEAAEDFFAVILDWIMPDMDGLETLKLIRKTVGMDTPIIIVSAYDFSEIEDKFRSAGADAFITKPLFKSKMVQTFHKFRRSGRSDSWGALGGKPNNALNGKKLLLAEDNELNREIAVELLETYGLLIDTAENGLIAVNKFEASAPGEYACILMDIQMPLMDGYKATKTIRGLERGDAHTIPILALTANAFASDIGKAHSAGMNDHIAKPIDIGILMETLERWIR